MFLYFQTAQNYSETDMSLLTEDEVYVAAKNLIKKHGWTIIAGQPPNGCDHLPVVEIKSSHRIGIGSKGAFKPDLIAVKKGVFIIVECKPAHSEKDADKIRNALADPLRTQLLYQELLQRRIFDRCGIKVSEEDFKLKIFGALAHSAEVKQMPDLIVLSVKESPAESLLIAPTNCSVALSPCL